MHRSLPAIAALGIAAGVAHGDDSSWHFTASGNIAATDNVFAVPSNQNPQADIFFQLRPGVLWAYDAPRTIQELTAQVELLDYVIHNTNSAVTGYGSWKGFLSPGPRSEALLAANASSGQLNALSSRSGIDAPPPGLVPTAAQPITVYEADASTYIAWIASRSWRLYDNNLAQYTGTDDNAEPTATKTYAGLAGATLGAERDFRDDALAFELGLQWVYLERRGPAEPVPPPPGSVPSSMLSRQVNPRALAIWRHDIGQHWSTSLTGGVVYLVPYAHDPYDSLDIDSPQLYPTASALVAYTQPWGRVTLTAAHAIAPNLLVAENTLDDSVVGQLALPLPWLDDNPHLRSPKLTSLAMLAVSRTELLNATSSALQSRFDIFRAALGVSWTPKPGRTFGLRYEFVYQLPTDAVAKMLNPAFFRDTLYFTFDLRFPDRVRVGVPRINASVRADRGDLAPVGAEPEVPDATQPADPTGAGDNP